MTSSYFTLYYYANFPTLHSALNLIQPPHLPHTAIHRRERQESPPEPDQLRVRPAPDLHRRSSASQDIIDDLLRVLVHGHCAFFELDVRSDAGDDGGGGCVDRGGW